MVCPAVSVTNLLDFRAECFIANRIHILSKTFDVVKYFRTIFDLSSLDYESTKMRHNFRNLKCKKITLINLIFGKIYTCLAHFVCATVCSKGEVTLSHEAEGQKILKANCGALNSSKIEREKFCPMGLK